MAESFSYDDLIASGEGRLFGPDAGRLPLPPMLMFDRITHIDGDGGAHGLHGTPRQQGEQAQEANHQRAFEFFHKNHSINGQPPALYGIVSS